MLVAGNDRVQTIISQLEDSCRVTKVRVQSCPALPAVRGSSLQRSCSLGKF
jgi:hypothetical protein